MTIQAKREELRQRVEASRGRFPPEPAEENEPLLADKVGEVAKQYPLALLGGALLVGLMLGLSGKRDEGEPRAIDKFDKKLSQILVDFLFAAGIGLLQDVSKSKVFDEEDEDQERASSAVTKNRLIRNAAEMAVEAGQKMRDSQKVDA